MIKPRKTLDSLCPYTPPQEGRKNAIRLDFNENTQGMGLHLTIDDASVYPEYSQVLSTIAKTYGLETDHLLLTNGSSEALFLAAFSFIEPDKDKAVTSTPTFALISHSLKLTGARLIELKTDLQNGFDLKGIEAVLHQSVKMAILASPDNPTGAVLSSKTLKKWCERFPCTLFVIDEAYGEYVQTTKLGMVMDHKNLLVIKTFSKAWGMAGLRLGFAAGDPELIRQMGKVRAPYSVNNAALLGAQKLLKRESHMKTRVRELMIRKKSLTEQVRQRGYVAHEGAANFFLIKAGLDQDSLWKFCRDQGVLIRKVPIKGVLRVTVGTAGENRFFLNCLDGFRKKNALVYDLDNVLVDTSSSYDRTVSHLMDLYSNQPLGPNELKILRAQGGFNDDWRAAKELLNRRGKRVPLEEVVQQGTQYYFSMVKQAESLLADLKALKALGMRRRLFIYTGRTRREYEQVWKETLDPIFERVLCVDDLPHLKPKPAPDQLAHLLKEENISSGFYLGDSVDDMAVARSLGFRAIGVASTVEPEDLIQEGAEMVVQDVNDFAKEMGV